MKKANLLTHLAAAAIVTILAGLIYASVQQAHRSGANDPQLQVAMDISNKVKQAGTAGKWFNTDTVEISQSLSVFSTLFDSRGEPVMSTGVLNGKMPHLPKGVFDFAKTNGENVFTWQPERSVRMAVVLKPLSSPAYSFVAVGRSLNEIEKREQNLLWMAFISWLLCMGVIMLHWLINFFKSRTLPGYLP
ncbi:MAG: hypothetical protein Q8941_00915 [Bacteroidota bacterium]|nr:hypothetical protein [Bacteroidota bacterium]